MGGDLVVIERAPPPVVVRVVGHLLPAQGPSLVREEPGGRVASQPAWRWALAKTLPSHAAQLYLVAGVPSSPPLVDVWA